MDTQKYKLNGEASRILYKNHKDMILEKRCYDNIYRLVVDAGILSIHPSWEVAFGYSSVNPILDFYVKHCFFFDGENIIDPTLADYDDTEYFIVKRYTYCEYLEKVIYTAEFDFYKDKEFAESYREFALWGYQNSLVLIG